MAKSRSKVSGFAPERKEHYRKREQPRTEGPQFVVTGLHVLIFITAVLIVAYFAGLLPDP